MAMIRSDLLFTNCSCSFQLQKPSRTVLSNLREVRENPPPLNVFLNPECNDPGNSQSYPNDPEQMEREADMAADSIDWDITLDSSQIDWDIGTVEETEENGHGLGPYEMVNASDLPNPLPDEDVKSDQPSLAKEETIVSGVSEPGISWDISVENPEVNIIDESGLSCATMDPQLVSPNTSSGAPHLHERSPLLETEYRNKILDDLFEVNVKLKLGRLYSNLVVHF